MFSPDHRGFAGLTSNEIAIDVAFFSYSPLMNNYFSFVRGDLLVQDESPLLVH